MADNTTRGRSTDRKRLNMSEPYEVAYAKSNRASPARKALLAKGEARSAKSGAPAQGAQQRHRARRAPAAKRSTGSAAKRSVRRGQARKSAASGERAGASAKSAAPAIAH